MKRKLGISTVIFMAAACHAGASTTLDLGWENSFNPSFIQVIAGTYNSTWTNSSILVGYSNSMGGSNSLLVGSMNYFNGSDSLSVGQYNDVSSDSAIMAGSNNMSYSGHNSITAGYANFNGSERGLVVGYGNNNWDEYNNDDLFGDAIVAGRYNAMVSKRAFLVIGNGTGSTGSNRKNAFVVYQDGDVIVTKRQGDISMGIYGN